VSPHGTSRRTSHPWHLPKEHGDGQHANGQHHVMSAMGPLLLRAGSEAACETETGRFNFGGSHHRCECGRRRRCLCCRATGATPVQCVSDAQRHCVSSAYARGLQARVWKARDTARRSGTLKRTHAFTHSQREHVHSHTRRD
jgi:hypothetical protein